ncbi:MAG: LysM peptidoglycan-binding domain-containing protein [Kiritimatiellae bacterium]|nr:LysM peptidoglycan-binding domain-containing protein [Kiritimatiellia bacterium]
MHGNRIGRKETMWAAALLMAAGCVSPWEQRLASATDAHERETLKADLKRLEARVEQLATAQQETYRELEKIRTANSDAVRRMREDLVTVQESIRNVEAARARDREEIIEALSKQIAALLKGQSTVGTRTERGVEHVVKSGETISSIAALYRVKPSAIIEANQIKDPNRLLVGTKLFIPEGVSGR